MESVLLRKKGAVTVATIPAGSLLSSPKHRTLIEELRALAAEVTPTLLLDIRDILLNDLHDPMGLNANDQHYFVSLLEPVWSSLKSRNCNLVLVVPRKKRSIFEMAGWENRCPIVDDEAEGLAAANELPVGAVPTLDDTTRAALTAIQSRFEQLVRERIGHFWNPPELPNIVHLYLAGERRGGHWIPGGGFRWSLSGSGSDLKLAYKDWIRMVGGWGCAYEVTPSQTTLTARDLD